MKLNLLYFAWLRERIGRGQEIIETDAETVTELIAELILRDPGYAAAFEDISSVRVAVDQNLVDFSTSLASVREVAFFPPITGG